MDNFSTLRLPLKNSCKNYKNGTCVQHRQECVWRRKAPTRRASCAAMTNKASREISAEEMRTLPPDTQVLQVSYDQEGRRQTSQPFPLSMAKNASAAISLCTQEYKEFHGIKQLGEGGSGTACLVDRTDGKQYVLKILPKSKNIKEKVLNEAHILETLTPKCKEYVICFTKFWEDEGNYYLVTDYLGENYVTLENILSSNKNENYRTLHALLPQLLAGLTAIHDSDIYHGDLNLGNILVDPKTGQVRYIDFGFSCLGDSCGENESMQDTIHDAAETFPFIDPDDTMELLKAEDRRNLARFLNQFLWGRSNEEEEKISLEGQTRLTLPPDFISKFPEDAKLLNVLFYGRLNESPPERKKMSLDFPTPTSTFLTSITSERTKDALPFLRPISTQETNFLRKYSTRPHYTLPVEGKTDYPANKKAMFRQTSHMPSIVDSNPWYQLFHLLSPDKFVNLVKIIQPSDIQLEASEDEKRSEIITTKSDVEEWFEKIQGAKFNILECSRFNGIVSSFLQLLLLWKAASTFKQISRTYLLWFTRNIVTDCWLQMVQMFNWFILSSPPLENPLIVYRGEPMFPKLYKLKSGVMVIPVEQILATSLSAPIAAGFTSENSSIRCCLYEIVLPPGFPIFSVDALLREEKYQEFAKFSGEDEVLLPATLDPDGLRLTYGLQIYSTNTDLKLEIDGELMTFHITRVFPVPLNKDDIDEKAAVEMSSIDKRYLPSAARLVRPNLPLEQELTRIQSDKLTWEFKTRTNAWSESSKRTHWPGHIDVDIPTLLTSNIIKNLSNDEIEYILVAKMNQIHENILQITE